MENESVWEREDWIFKSQNESDNQIKRSMLSSLDDIPISLFTNPYSYITLRRRRLPLLLAINQQHIITFAETMKWFISAVKSASYGLWLCLLL